MQEIYVARMVIFVCGQNSIGWSPFLAAYNLLRMFCQKYSETPKNRYFAQWRLIQEAIHVVDPILLGSILYQGNPTAQPLRSLLQAVRGRMCTTEPRDMVYGLIGIAADRVELGIDVDYRKPVPEVYMDVTRSLIRQGHLDIIYEATERIETRRYELPSWVPDYSTSSSVSNLSMAFDEEPEFSAAGNRPLLVSVDKEPKIGKLAVLGVQVGSIDGYGRIWDKRLGLSIEAIRAWFEDLDHLLSQHTIRYKGLEAVWATPVARSKADESTQQSCKDIVYATRHTWNFATPQS